MLSGLQRKERGAGLARTCRDGRHRESQRENASDERHQARLVERGGSVQCRLDVDDDPAACCSSELLSSHEEEDSVSH